MQPQAPALRQRGKLRAPMALLMVLIMSLCHIVTRVSHAAVFKISVNLPFETPSLGKAVANIVKFIKSNEVMLQGIDPNNQHTFQMIYTPTNYTARNATIAMLNAIINDGAVAALGDFTSSSTIPQAHAGSKWFMYMCSGGATSGQLSDKTAFPFFFRSICQDPAQGAVLAHFIKYMRWNSAALIASSDAYGQSVGTAFLTTAQTLGVSVVQNQVIQPGQTDYSIALNAILNSGSQIIVLSALSENSILLLRQARAMGMIGPEWVWIGPEAFDYWMDLQINAEDVKNVQGMLYVYPLEKTYTASFNASLARYNAAYPNEPPSPPSYSFLFLDCMMAMAKGILRLAQDVSPADIVARNYHPNLKKHFLEPFDGVTGQVQYDESGNRLSPFQVFNLYNGVSTAVYDVLPDLSVVSRAPVKFNSGTSVVPSDRPKQTSLVPTLDSPAGVALLAINIVVISAVVATWGLLFVKRNDPSVRSLSFPFLTLICLGCVSVLLSNVSALGTPTAIGCQASLWLFCYGIELVLASSAAKAYRLWLIFDNKQISAGKVGNKYLFAGVAAIMLGQTIILAVWTGMGAQQAILVSSRTYFLYKCSSTSVSTNTALSAVTIVYNFLLLVALIFLAYKTRNIASNFRESQWMFYTGQNTLLSGVVVSAFAFFDFGDSHLSAFIVKQIAIIYSVGFAFAALVGRIAIVELRSLGSSSSKAGAGTTGLSTSQSGSKIGAANSPTPSSTAVQDGKSGTIKATLPVKKLNSLMSTWIRHHVGLHVTDGYLSLVPAREDPELGVVLRLQHIQFDASGAFENCLEVSTKGKAWVIQFTSAEERDKWTGMLQSTSASRRGGAAGQTSSAGAGATSRKGMIANSPSSGNI